ncbi:putative ribonuclease H-like domain-containing protein [Tanacetum coccineum]|uniref:Ribonuclease H-like domain-containing protein n=1 Tax=Tanacetum coccineum TaxID=301880 RepID=A0ABQ5C505_9ASTR
MEDNVTALTMFNTVRDDEDDGVVADMNNLDTTIQLPQTRKMSKEFGGNSCIEGSKLDRSYAGRAYTIQVTRSLNFSEFTKWNKKDERGIMIRNKARLVAQGYTQEEMIEIMIVFLYGKIEEEVYVCQPPGFKDPDFPDRVYKVEKALFQRGKIDKTYLSKDTKMSSMGELTFFLGLQMEQKKDGIFISQDRYVGEILKKFEFTKVKTASTPIETQKILKKFGFIEIKTTSTPIETQKPLLKEEDGEEVDVHMYSPMIGSLMYLTSSRPDIMFAVCACARYQVNPKVLYLHDVKRIFSDYAGASLDRKSTT